MTHPRASTGFTIVEAAISIVIVGGLLVASTATFGMIARMRQTQIESRLAYSIAQQLMTEILQCYFQQQATTPVFGPVAGQTRAQFNYVDAYNGYIASPPTSHSGTALSGYANWTESVSVSFINVSSPANIVSSSALKQIKVTVTAPSGKQYSLTGMRSIYGTYESQPSVQTNYVTGVSIGLAGAGPAKTVYSGAHPLNVAASQ